MGAKELVGKQKHRASSPQNHGPPETSMRKQVGNRPPKDKKIPAQVADAMQAVRIQKTTTLTDSYRKHPFTRPSEEMPLQSDGNGMQTC